jgi:hypothetical protein
MSYRWCLVMHGVELAAALLSRKSRASSLGKRESRGGRFGGVAIELDVIAEVGCALVRSCDL